MSIKLFQYEDHLKNLDIDEQLELFCIGCNLP